MSLQDELIERLIELNKQTPQEETSAAAAATEEDDSTTQPEKDVQESETNTQEQVLPAPPSSSEEEKLQPTVEQQPPPSSSDEKHPPTERIQQPTPSSPEAEKQQPTEKQEQSSALNDEKPAASAAGSTKPEAPKKVEEQHETAPKKESIDAKRTEADAPMQAQDQPIAVSHKRAREESSEEDTTREHPSQKARIDPSFDATVNTTSYSIEDLYDSERPEVPPPTGEGTENVLISGLQRPFTSPQLKELLEKAGKLNSGMEGGGIWLQKFKKYAIASFQSKEDSEAVRNALHGVKWPSHSQKRLEIEFTEHTADDASKHGDPLERAATAQPVKKSQTMEVQSSEGKAGLNDEKPADAAAKSTEQVSKNTGTLDSLFMSTEAQPKLYYLPLDEEAAQAKKRRQQDLHLQGVNTPTTPEGAEAMSKIPPRRGRGGFRGGRPFRGRGGPRHRDSFDRPRFNDRDRRDDGRNDRFRRDDDRNDRFRRDNGRDDRFRRDDRR